MPRPRPNETLREFIDRTLVHELLPVRKQLFEANPPFTHFEPSYVYHPYIPVRVTRLF
jgi:hypothetical protein